VCPLVLALLVTRPRAAHEVADALRRLGLADAGFAAAQETLGRLRAAGLVWARPTSRARQPVFAVTARGRREHGLQPLLAARTTGIG
jgi:hypothetical protein